MRGLLEEAAQSFPEAPPEPDEEEDDDDDDIPLPKAARVEAKLHKDLSDAWRPEDHEERKPDTWWYAADDAATPEAARGQGTPSSDDEGDA